MPLLGGILAANAPDICHAYGDNEHRHAQIGQTHRLSISLLRLGKALIRTVINLTVSQKAWLDQQAVLRRVSISSLIRRAVSEYRIREQRRAGVPFEEVLNLTAGIWEAEDGFDYQERIRKEWRGALDSG